MATAPAKPYESGSVSGCWILPPAAGRRELDWHVRDRRSERVRHLEYYSAFGDLLVTRCIETIGLGEPRCRTGSRSPHVQIGDVHGSFAS